MQMSLSLKQSAEKLGISFSHYDIDGHLIDASPTSIDYFIEQFEKTIPYSTALSFIACFVFYLSSFNAFCRSTNEKIQSVVNNQAYKA